jgi:hypothetical protein
MKKFKVILSLLPVLAIASFIYFSALGFSHVPEVKTNTTLAKPSATTLVAVHLSDIGGNHCLTGNYYYCVNGGPAIPFSFPGEIEVPCDEYVTICVTSDAPCTGSWTGFVSCGPNPKITIDLSPFNARCNCR